MADYYEDLAKLMKDPRMPAPAREYFSRRVVNQKVGTVMSAKLHIALARQCVEIGNELVTATDKQKKEVDGLLSQPTTYKQDTLAAICDGLAASVPGEG